MVQERMWRQMAKTFNINGACSPSRHYVVSLASRLRAIRAMIDKGEYYKARQYGKTTTQQALTDYLKNDYTVMGLDFQRISALSFESEPLFVAAFSEELLYFVKELPEKVRERLQAFMEGTAR